MLQPTCLGVSEVFLDLHDLAVCVCERACVSMSMHVCNVVVVVNAVYIMADVFICEYRIGTCGSFLYLVFLPGYWRDYSKVIL